MMAGLYMAGTFTAVALGGLLVRVACTAVLVGVSSQGSHGLTWHWRHASMAEIKSLFKPALSFMVFPLSSALSLQGITLLVGHFFGPAVVAVFNSYRTIACKPPPSCPTPCGVSSPSCLAKGAPRPFAPFTDAA